MILASALPIEAAAVNATWNAATDVPVTAASYTATGNSVNFTLNFAPATGTNLTVVNNTGLPFVSGTYDNLTQGQAVALSYGGVTYNYVAHYYGGTGNDLVLVWAVNRVFSWGTNYYGQIGDGTYTQREVMVPVTGWGVLAGKTIIALAQGGNYNMALCADGTVAAWGDNTYGQLGDNTTTQRIEPVRVNTDSGVSDLHGKTVVAIAAGYARSMALCSDGTVATWGEGYAGQLGNNSTTDNWVPVAVNTTNGVSALYGKTVVAIASGQYHGLALCSDGTVAAWGQGYAGQLGNNNYADSWVPVTVNAASGVSTLFGKTAVSLAAGETHSLALCSDGTVAAWGENLDGELGNNGPTNKNVSVPVAVNTASGVSALYGKTVVALAAGQWRSMVLCSDGTVAGWGYNSTGQLGNNGYTKSLVPVAVNTASGVSALSGKTVVSIATNGVSGNNTTALCSDGTLAVWGQGGYGIFGNYMTTYSAVPVAVVTSPIATSERLVMPASSSNPAMTTVLVAEPPSTTTTVLTLAATTVGSTMAGLNGSANPNNGSATVTFDYGPTTDYGSSTPAAPYTVTGGSATMVSAKVSGLLPLTTYHFRINAGGSLGNDQTFTTVNNDVSLAALTMSAGNLTPAFTSGTTSYFAGSVSTVTDTITVTPTLTDGHASVAVNGVTVASGNASTPVRLGYGNNVIRVQVTAQDGVTTQMYSIAIARTLSANLSATYFSGGDVPVNVNGFNATGSTINLTLSYAPPTGTSLMVVNNVGTGFISGAFDNLTQGQLVVLTCNNIGYKFVANYFGGTGNDLVLVWADNRALAWGYNGYGQLGNSSYLNQPIPAPVTTTGMLAGKTIIALSAGSYHSLALCSDGTLAAWGYNISGEVGDTTTTPRNEPVAVSTASGVSALYGKRVVAISAGYSSSMALCSDGTVVTWGLNSYGALGDNTTTTRKAPVAVNTASGVSALYGKIVIAIASGQYHKMALCADGTVVAWGMSYYGQLGNNSNTFSISVPVAVNAADGVSALNGKTVVSVAAGAFHSLALCSDGSIASWGQGSNGALGNADTSNSNVPVAVSTMYRTSALYGKTAVAIAAGQVHNLALCTDGTVVSWGNNNFGQLGDNGVYDQYAPVTVNAASGISSLYGKTVTGLAAGNSQSAAQCSDGSIVTWGSGSYGQLGNNSLTDSHVPVTPDSSALAAGEKYVGVAGGFYAYQMLGLVAAPPPAPAVTSLAASSISGTSATLNSSVNAGYSTTAVSFDYGLTNAYGANVAAVPASLATGSATAVSVTLTNLSPLTTYHFRINGVSGVGATSGGDLTFTTLALSLMETWRQTYFGTTASTGTVADAADFDHDGVPNLIEWACHLDPTTRSTLPITTVSNGANFEYTYSRSTAAVTAGTTITVQWSDTLAPGSWSAAGVTQTVLSDDGTTQQVKALIPINAASAKFVRLSVTAPP